MRRIPLFLLACLSFYSLQAQRGRPSATNQLMAQLEENMQNYANDIVNARETVDRFRADSFFTRALVQALSPKDEVT